MREPALERANDPALEQARVDSKPGAIAAVDAAPATPCSANRERKPPDFVEHIDRSVNAGIARLTLGISPAVLSTALLDWVIHLGLSPGKQLQLMEMFVDKSTSLALFALSSLGGAGPQPCVSTLRTDKRFSDPAWSRLPFSLFAHSFLLTQQWWHSATTDVRGLEPRNAAIVNFVARQMLDMVAPSNALWTNPFALSHTLRTNGSNLHSGWRNLIDDVSAAVDGRRGQGNSSFIAGHSVAVTPGEVVYRNELIELLQYRPTTEQVHAEPVLMVPAWIMKYYILDLSPHNSLVRYLVDKGHTVFMISWRNPGAEHRLLAMDDYRRLGVMAALQAIEEILPDTRVHALGYCLGGTLLAIAAAAMARELDDRLATLTLLTTQIDFTEPGEMMLFMTEDQVTFLEDMMWDQGYLDSSQMAGAFQLLRSNDLIWSRIVKEYVLGERQDRTDLMAWNADATRLPYRMHSEYLRSLFLRNDLARGAYVVDGRPIAMQDIHIPVFVVATESDHVAPWRSVYKIQLLADTPELAFLLASGGHNAGIISEPGHARRHFRFRVRYGDNGYLDPDEWLATTPPNDGSWWPVWQEWVRSHSTGQIAPPSIGAVELPPLCPAPGAYVLER